MTSFHSTDRTVVITGASDGIGAAAARQLSARGYDVVVVGRSKQKTLAVANELKAQSFVADFAHLESVNELARSLRSEVGAIDVLANNAGGVFGRQRSETDDGHETTFQVNYLAPFLLTRLLLDSLLATKGSVISTSSVAHRLFARLNLDDLDMRSGRFNPRIAYGNAKLGQVLFTKELDRRCGAQGLSSAAFHPGIIGSGFASSKGAALGWVYTNPLSRRVMAPPDAGADTLTWLVDTLPGEESPSGAYFSRRKAIRPSRRAADLVLAEQLWEQSTRMVSAFL